MNHNKHINVKRFGQKLMLILSFYNDLKLFVYFSLCLDKSPTTVYGTNFPLLTHCYSVKTQIEGGRRKKEIDVQNV